MSATTLDLSCQCGAKLRVVATWASDVQRERREFDVAHAICRERPTRRHEAMTFFAGGAA